MDGDVEFECRKRRTFVHVDNIDHLDRRIRIVQEDGADRHIARLSADTHRRACWSRKRPPFRRA
eukprot:3051514-Prymnesium_polylepis.1